MPVKFAVERSKPYMVIHVSFEPFNLKQFRWSRGQKHTLQFESVHNITIVQNPTFSHTST